MELLAEKEKDITNLFEGKNYSIHKIKPPIELTHGCVIQEVIVSDGEGCFESAYTFKRPHHAYKPRNRREFDEIIKICTDELIRDEQAVSENRGLELGRIEGFIAGENSKFKNWEIYFKILMGVACLLIMAFLSYILYENRILGNSENLSLAPSKNLIILFIIFMGLLTAGLAFGHGVMKSTMSRLTRLANLN